VIYCYVADEHWNAGLGHRTRFEALAEAVAELGDRLQRSDDPGCHHCKLDDAGNLLLPNPDRITRDPIGWEVLDGLRYALLRPQFAKERPKALRPDWWPTVACTPSTRALEAICLGFRVELLSPRNAGEYRLWKKLLEVDSAESLFWMVDGGGALRCADLLTSHRLP